MIGFVLAAAAMIVCCVLLVVVPLWRARGEHAEPIDGRRQANIDAYRQRVRELDADTAAGRIDADTAAREKQALGTRLISEVDTSSTPRSAPLRRGPWAASIAAAFLVVFSGTLGYYWLGNYAAIEEADTPNIEELMNELAAQVQANPEDRGARLMLAQAYESRGAYQKAVEQLAYVNAHAVPPVADLLVAEAQARLKAGEELDEAPGRLFQRVLVQDPDNIAALWFLGLRAAEAGQNEQALRFWDRLLEQDLSADVRNMVQSRRRALAGELPSLG